MANSWGAFNPNNLGGKTLDSLRNDIYAGFRTKTKTIQGRQGKYGRGRSSTKQVFNAGYYRDHPGWSGIGDKLGININSQNDVRQLFDYVSGYKPPAPAPKPAAAPKAAAPKPASNPYKEQSSALLKTIDSLVQSMDKPAPEPPPPPKTIFAGSSNVSNANNLQIAPAAGINKRGGTNNFKRRANSTSSSNLRTIQSVNV